MVPLSWFLGLIAYLPLTEGFFTPPSNAPHWLQGSQGGLAIPIGMNLDSAQLWDFNNLLQLPQPPMVDLSKVITTTAKPAAAINGNTLKIGNHQFSISELLKIVESATKTTTTTPKPTTQAPILSALAALFDPKLFQIAVEAVTGNGNNSGNGANGGKVTEKKTKKAEKTTTTTTTTTPSPITIKTTPSPKRTLAEILQEKEAKAAQIRTAPDGTIKEKGCVHKGVFYRPSAEIERGQSGDWCYGTYCNHEGVLVHWDDHTCATPTPATPSTTPSSAGCYSRGRWYAPGEDIENTRSLGICYGTYCDQSSQIRHYEEPCSATDPHMGPYDTFTHEPYRDPYGTRPTSDPSSSSDPFSMMAALSGAMGGASSAGNPFMSAFGGSGASGRGGLASFMSKK